MVSPDHCQGPFSWGFQAAGPANSLEKRPLATTQGHHQGEEGKTGAERAVVGDRAGITASRAIRFLQPALLLNRIVQPQKEGVQCKDQQFRPALGLLSCVLSC
jgi:hypothetical protein